MAKAKTGFFQELQPDGSVANSSTRLYSLAFAVLTIALLCFLTWAFNEHVNQLFAMADKKSIDQGTFVVLLQSMQIISPTILVVLGVMIFVPKYLQKLAELKLGKLSDLPKEEVKPEN